MNKKEVKNILKNHGFTMITPSWYKDKDCVLFNAYNNRGDVWYFYINSKTKYSCYQYLSSVGVHDSHVINWFFKEV